MSNYLTRLKVFPPKKRPAERKHTPDQQPGQPDLDIPQSAEDRSGEAAPLRYPIPRTSGSTGQGST